MKHLTEITLRSCCFLISPSVFSGCQFSSNMTWAHLVDDILWLQCVMGGYGRVSVLDEKLYWNNSSLILHSSFSMQTFFFLYYWWKGNFTHGGILSLSLIERHNLKMLFFFFIHQLSCSVFYCLGAIIDLPSFIFHWSCHWEIRIDSLHICTCLLLCFQMLILTVTAFKNSSNSWVSNSVSMWVGSHRWDYELWIVHELPAIPRVYVALAGL